MDVQDFMDKFESHVSNPAGIPIVHFGSPYGFMELDKEFHKKLRDEFEKRIMLCASGVDKMSTIEQFAFWVLSDSY
jgi:hypothetical protein